MDLPAPTVATEETSVLACKPSLLFRKDGPVVFTKKYVKHTLFSKKEYKPGAEGMIVKCILALSVESRT